MALAKCELCGRLFNSYGLKVCRVCTDEVEKSYIKVRNFIYQNPDKKRYSVIVEETETSEKMLNYLIDSGRIVVEDIKMSGTRCKACGTITAGAAFCDKCKTKLISQKLISNNYGSEVKTQPRIKPLSSYDDYKKKED